MHKFFFTTEIVFSNDESHNLDTLSNLFEKTLKEYQSLVDDDIEIEKGIITEKMPSQINITNKISLIDLINKIETKELKRIAYGYFTKYPIELNLEISQEEEEEMVFNNYEFTINNQSHPVFYLITISNQKGYLFTLPIHKELEQNTLNLISEKESLVINNLYGNIINTKFIKKHIEERNRENLSNFKKLEDILKIATTLPYFSTAFKRDFDNLNNEEQLSIIELFERAKNRNFSSPFFPDTKIIADLNKNVLNTKLYELRVYTPTALRVYFAETEICVFVSSLELKSNPDQNKDIQKAANRLKKLLLTKK